MKIKSYTCENGKSLIRLCILTINFQLLFFCSFSQNIGINTTGATPDPSTILDLNTGNTFTSPNGKGLLIPNIALTGATDAVTIGSPATSLLIYNTATAGVSPNNVAPGYYYWNGVKWVSLISGGSGWLLTGNAGTVDGTNFIGTTDNVPFNIRVNNQKAGRIDATLYNTFFGYLTGNTNVAGSNITAVGYNAMLYANSSAMAFNSNNVAFGYEALRGSGVAAANTGTNNTALGFRTLWGNTSGSYSTASGYYALYSNTTGANNTANGAFTLYTNNGSCNTASGYGALMYNTSGSNNTASGVNALTTNNSGSNNVASGLAALQFNTTGNYNTAVGVQALNSNVAGSNATAIGMNAMLYANNSATAFNSNNVALGYEALRGSATAASNTGTNNTALGYQTLWYNTTGTSNCASGMLALNGNTTGNNNTACGYAAGFSNSTGSGNVFIGYNAGLNETGSNKLYIANSSINPPLIYGDFSTGNTGFGSITPLSKLEVNGALATTIVKATTAKTLDNTAEVWYLTTAASIFTLPAANTCTNRRYILVARGVAITTSIAYTTLAGALSTTVASNSSVEIISDGTNWLQIK